ncbi:WD40 repeat domain-containing protein [Nonomuraea sp. SYSU D8015]|uniref:WD40 repeat domain-containing protein n=1 Tax=Nonomuraea sp. SYSU D8015 TaxID=2593644 RepID=UPI0016614ED9|nr:hypothetical protein [Nonomuraea sp. SYSU D8015]
MLRDLVAVLASGRHRVVGLVPEIDGAEGFGTTALAAAACRSPEVRERFPDGIEWLTLGDEPLHHFRQRVKEPEGKDLPFRRRRPRRLVVLDDVRPHAAELVNRVAAGNAVVLVTSRTAPRTGHVIRLPALPPGDDPSQGWPLLRTLTRSLDAAPVHRFDLADPSSRARVVHQVLDRGLRRTLAPALLERLLELGVFGGGRPIPLDLLAALWWETAGLSRAEAERTLAELGERGLLARAPDRDVVLIPDAVRAHLRAAMGPDRARRANRAMVEIGPPGDTFSDEAVTYYFEHFADHLEAVGGRLQELVCQASWLAAKLLEDGPALVQRELERAGTEEAEQLHRTLSQSLHLLGEPPYSGLSVLSTLAGRLHHLPRLGQELRDFLNALGLPWLECMWTPPDLPHPSLRRTWTAHEEEASSVAISPDGTWLATAGWDGPVRLWNRDGTPRAVLEAHLGLVNAIAIAPCGTWLASAGCDGTVHLWSAAGEHLKELFTIGAQDVAVSPDGDWLACICIDGTLTAWNREGEELWTAGTGYADAALSTLALAADGSWVAHLTDGRIHVWNADGTPRASFPHEGALVELTAHPVRDAMVTTDGCVYSPDGDLLERIPIDGHPSYPVAMAPDGSWLATGGIGDHVLVTRLDRPATERLSGHLGSVSDVAISPDGTWLASVATDGTACIWAREDLPRIEADDESRRGLQKALIVAPYGLVTVGQEPAYRDEAGHVVRTLSGLPTFDGLSGCDSWFAAYSRDGEVWLIDGDGGVRGSVRTDHDGRQRSLVVAPDGTWFATCGEEGVIVLWSRAGDEIGRLRQKPGWPCLLAVSADGSTLAAASGGVVQRWTSRGRRIGRARRPGDSVVALALSPDGSRTAATLTSGVTREWDHRSKRSADFAGSPGVTAALSYSPSGTLLAATYGSALHLWDVAVGARQPLAGIRLGASLNDCAWSPDGTRLYAVGDAGVYGFTLHVANASP